MSDVIRFPIERARPPGPILMGRPAATRAGAAAAPDNMTDEALSQGLHDG